MNIGRIEEPSADGMVKTLYDARAAEDSAAILREVEIFVARFVALPLGALLPLALWMFATHCFESFDVFPYIAITSPVPRCGKSTLLDLIGMLSRNAIPASNISEAALFRTISEERPVLLLDEAEWLKEKSERAQIVRNLLNAGHRSNALAIRCEKDGKRNTFRVFCPKAIAAIGELSNTLADRSVAIAMQRRAANERSGRFRFARVKRDADPLHQKISQCVNTSKAAITAAYESLPDLTFLDERAADNWSPLFAVLGVVDPRRVDELKGCGEMLSSARADSVDDSLPLRLLADLFVVAKSRNEKIIRTDELLDGAREEPENPWTREVELTARKAAKWLREFGIRPVRTKSYRGYERQAILDVANKYLRHQPSAASGSVSRNSHKDLGMTDADAPDGNSARGDINGAARDCPSGD